MIDATDLLSKLSDLDIDFFTGVSDSVLGAFCSTLHNKVDSSRHVLAANEGGAIGIAIGYYLATGKVPLVYMQNSGLGNAFSGRQRCLFGANDFVSRMARRARAVR